MSNIYDFKSKKYIEKPTTIDNDLNELLKTFDNDDTEMSINEKLYHQFNHQSNKLKHLLQNGYLKISDNILYHIINSKKCKLSYTEICLLMFLMKKTIGFQRVKWKLNIKEIYESLDINKVYVYQLIEKLINKDYILKENNYIIYQGKNFVDIDRKGYTPIPDYLLYALINKDYISRKYELILYLYILKRSFGYNDYKIIHKQRFTETFKLKRWIEKKKTADIKEWFYINGYKDITEMTGIDRRNTTNIIKKLISKNMIELEKGPENIWIKVKYDIKEWILE